jgi:hypothetical protein
MPGRALRLAVVLLVCASSPARSDDLSPDEIFDRPKPFVVESLRLRYSHYDQDGRGYQSRADRNGPFSPGLETASIEQGQLEVVAQQGKFTHRLWVPVDVITAASPDAINGWPPPDAVTEASRINESGTVDLSSTYHKDRDTDVGINAAFHLEEPFRSWILGVAASRAFFEQNTIVSASLNQVLDWLDRFDLKGFKVGRDFRSSTNANLGLTQLLSPTTIGHLEYGVTVQLGELSNTWNVTALSDGTLAREELPHLRHRHAFVGRLVQALPWNGVLKAYERFYVDNWGVLANTVELQLYQRFTSFFYLRASYRFHHQTAPTFWTLAADPAAPYRTSDSDLANLSAHSFGALAAVDVKLMHIDFGYERYFRTNGLHANLYTCSVGFRF